MISFNDGPAKGHILTLERAPVFLRVCIDDTGHQRKVDALDQRADEPRAGEQLHAYVLSKVPSVAFIRPGGRRIIAEYQLCAEQPSPSQITERDRWELWCVEQVPAVTPVPVLRYMVT